MNKAYGIRDTLKRATHTRAGATISAATRTELDGALDALDDAQIAIDRALERITTLIDMPAGDADTSASAEERAVRARGYHLVDAEVDGGAAAQKPTDYYVGGKRVTVPVQEPLDELRVVRRAAAPPSPGAPGYTLVDAE